MEEIDVGFDRPVVASLTGREGFLPRIWSKFLIGLMLLALVGIAVKAPRELWGTAFLSLLNLCILFFACYRLARTGRLHNLLLVLFLAPLITAWPAPMLYAALFAPDISHTASVLGDIAWLQSGVRVQLAELAFLAGFLPVIWLAARRVEAAPATDPAALRRWAVGTAALYIGIVAFQALFGEVGVGVLSGIGSSWLQYLANGLALNGVGLVFVPCALIVYMPRWLRVLFFAMVLLMAFIYTVGNLRGFVTNLSLMATAGLLVSPISKKAKTAFLIGLLVAMPLYIVIGNTTRNVLSSKGLTDFSYRLEALKGGWRGSLAESNPVSNLLSRLFMAGGHAVIVYTPDNVPYRQFRATDVGKDIAASLLWVRLTGWYRESANFWLVDYGFMVTEYTSVEISLIGYLWIYGGFLAVFLGGLFIGLLYYTMARGVRRASNNSYLFGLVLVGVLSGTCLAGSGFEVAFNVGSMFRASIFAIVLYLGLRVLLGDHRAAVAHDELGLAGWPA